MNNLWCDLSPSFLVLPAVDELQQAQIMQLTLIFNKYRNKERVCVCVGERVRVGSIGCCWRKFMQSKPIRLSPRAMDYAHDWARS